MKCDCGHEFEPVIEYRHRLLIGDCTVRENVERLMGGERANLWLLDPPYGIEWAGSNASTQEWEMIQNDENNNIAKDIIGKIPEDTNAVVFGANCFPELLPHRGRWICWDKRLTENADKMLGSPFELAWMNKTSGFDVMIRVLHGGVVNADGGKRYHPTQKPIELYTKIIELFKALIIYDGCAGSGTSILAAHNLNRRCYAMEISPSYCGVILERFHTAFPNEKIEMVQDA